MPHVVFKGIIATADVDTAPRTLIPGIEPGGSRAGQPTKPALLIRDCRVVGARAQIASGADADFACVVSLKLSQETDLTPGLVLPIATLIAARGQGDGTGSWVQDLPWRPVFHAQGTVWAPRVVGINVDVSGGGTFNQLSCDVHLDYEMVDVPWMDWFVMWDFLDNIVDNEEEY